MPEYATLCRTRTLSVTCRDVVYDIQPSDQDFIWISPSELVLLKPHVDLGTLGGTLEGVRVYGHAPTLNTSRYCQGSGSDQKGSYVRIYKV